MEFIFRYKKLSEYPAERVQGGHVLGDDGLWWVTPYYYAGKYHIDSLGDIEEFEENISEVYLIPERTSMPEGMNAKTWM